MVQLLSSPFPDLMYVSQSQLTQDFVQQIVNDQKTYGRGLMVSGVDASEFPVISVTLSGREDVLQEVVEHSTVVSRDTHREVSYTAQTNTGSYVDVCALLDCSGSMDGEPIRDLKEALTNFINGLRKETSVSLVAFDNQATSLTDLTEDQTLLLQRVDSLSADGGTNITAGIQEGLETLNNAGGTRVMLLMTDGQSDIDFSVVDRAAETGVVIHTIGFGGVNSSLLEEIASRTQGQFIYADFSTELSSIYASLQQIMGNLVTLEYTVENTEITENRYFYIKTSDYSVRIEYSLPQPKTDPSVYCVYPSLIADSEIQRMKDNGGLLSLYLEGSKLTDVESVSIGGVPGNITKQDGGGISVELTPELPNGWNTVTAKLTDGREISFDRLLLVGEVRSFQNIRLGSLAIPYGQGILPGDGTLVLGGNISIQENTQEQSTLDLSMQGGTLALPWNLPMSAEDGFSAYDVNLGNSGTISGWGRIHLGQNDGAFESGAPNTIVRGAFVIECGLNQSRLILEEDVS